MFYLGRRLRKLPIWLPERSKFQELQRMQGEWCQARMETRRYGLVLQRIGPAISLLLSCDDRLSCARFWPIGDVAPRLTEVRLSRQRGPDLLNLSSLHTAKTLSGN